MMKIKDTLGNEYDMSNNYNEMLLKWSYDVTQKTEPHYDTTASRNELILYFQYEEFYKQELACLQNPELVTKLNENRLKHINKSLKDLTPLQILRGVKISSLGKFSSYSHFGQHWMRAFIKEFDVKSIFDPCGGWGHRLASCSREFPYIYNDINKKVFENVQKIAQFLEMTNKSFYNEDASVVQIKEDYDATFTCPPYYNTEIYSAIGAENKSHEEFDSWWANVVQNACKKGRLFAFVINNKFKERMQEITIKQGLKFIKEIQVGTPKNLNHFQRKGTRYIKKGEQLLVFSI